MARRRCVQVYLLTMILMMRPEEVQSSCVQDFAHAWAILPRFSLLATILRYQLKCSSLSELHTVAAAADISS